MGAAAHRRRKGQAATGGPDHGKSNITTAGDLIGDRIPGTVDADREPARGDVEQGGDAKPAAKRARKTDAKDGE